MRGTAAVYLFKISKEQNTLVDASAAKTREGESYRSLVYGVTANCGGLVISIIATGVVAGIAAPVTGGASLFVAGVRALTLISGAVQCVDSALQLRNASLTPEDEMQIIKSDWWRNIVLGADIISLIDAAGAAKGAVKSVGAISRMTGQGTLNSVGRVARVPEAADAVKRAAAIVKTSVSGADNAVTSAAKLPAVGGVSRPVTKQSAMEYLLEQRPDLTKDTAKEFLRNELEGARNYIKASRRVVQMRQDKTLLDAIGIFFTATTNEPLKKMGTLAVGIGHEFVLRVTTPNIPQRTQPSLTAPLPRTTSLPLPPKT